METGWPYMPLEQARELAISSPAGLAWYATKGFWKPARHLELLTQRLIDVAARRLRRLIITFPPRHGKSFLTSHYFPAWYLGRFPDHRIILTSYSDHFAAEWGQKARDVTEEHGKDLFGITVRSDSKAAGRWNIDGRRGGMNAVGAGGSITGRGADLLIIDDPYENSEQANSELIRNKVWDWYVSTARTRLQPGGCIVLIQTRWHVEDLAGKLLAQEKASGKRQWTVVNFPAVAEENDALGRAVGEPLWPEMFPLAELESLKAEQGSYWFNAMYQQRPTLPEGNLFKRHWFEKRFQFTGTHYIVPGTPRPIGVEDCYTYCVVDPAASEKQTADYTAIGSFCVTPNNDLLILDMVRERIGLESIVQRILVCCRLCNAGWVSMESSGFQVGIALQARRTHGMPSVKELKHEGKGKLPRAHSAIVKAEARQIFLPEEAPWIEDFLEELTQFTGKGQGEKDDQTDCLAYAVADMDRGVGFGVKQPPIIQQPSKFSRRYQSNAEKRGLFGRGAGRRR